MLSGNGILGGGLGGGRRVSTEHWCFDLCWTCVFGFFVCLQWELPSLCPGTVAIVWPSWVSTTELLLSPSAPD